MQLKSKLLKRSGILLLVLLCATLAYLRWQYLLRSAPQSTFWRDNALGELREAMGDGLDPHWQVDQWEGRRAWSIRGETKYILIAERGDAAAFERLKVYAKKHPRLFGESGKWDVLDMDAARGTPTSKLIHTDPRFSGYPTWWNLDALESGYIIHETTGTRQKFRALDVLFGPEGTNYVLYARMRID